MEFSRSTLKIIPLAPIVYSNASKAKTGLRLKNMADEMMNENQGGNMGTPNKGGKAWGWVVLIIIILLVIWGLFALGGQDAADEADNNQEVGEGLDEIEEGLDDLGDDLDAMEDAEAELNVEGDAMTE